MVRFLTLGVVVCIVSMSGCGKKDVLEEPTPAIQLQLNWIPDAQHGGFFAAVVDGYFAEEGLDVEIVPGGPGTAAIPKLAMGRCDFAIGNADQVLLAREQGADVVAVFAAMQDSPRCIMVHEKSGMTSLEQLANVTLALGDGKAFAEYLKLKVPLENVRIVSYSGTVAKFLLDEGFAQQGYVFSEPILAAQEGGDPKSLMVSELGFNPYSSLVIANQETVSNDPELVRKFVSAVRKGWQSYLQDPSAANEAIVKLNSEMDANVLAKSAAAIRPLCGDSSSLGAMRAERWELLRTQLVELGLLPVTSKSSAGAFSESFVAIPE